MDLNELRRLRESGEFHHATYRNHGTLWEGLWIYVKAEDGFKGFVPAGSFPKESVDLKAAEEIVRGTGVSVGSFGRG